MALPVKSPIEIKNGRITTDWIDDAVVQTRTNTHKIDRLADEIRKIRTDTWTLHLGNLVDKLRVFAAWFSGQSKERREEIVAKYTDSAVTYQNRIIELLNSASTTAAALEGFKAQIEKVMAMFKSTKGGLTQSYDDASANFFSALALASPDATNK